MPKKPIGYSKRERFYATDCEQNLILALRQYAGLDLVRSALTESILSQLEKLERQKEYLKKEGQELTEEYKEICMALPPLELIYLHWRELIKEITGEK